MLSLTMIKGWGGNQVSYIQLLCDTSSKPFTASHIPCNTLSDAAFITQDIPDRKHGREHDYLVAWLSQYTSEGSISSIQIHLLHRVILHHTALGCTPTNDWLGMPGKGFHTA